MNHPFVKFIMVLAAIVAVAITVWIVFEVIEEITDNRRDRDYDSWEYERRSSDSDMREVSDR